MNIFDRWEKITKIGSALNTFFGACITFLVLKEKVFPKVENPEVTQEKLEKPVEQVYCQCEICNESRQRLSEHNV